jgi:hypothetical protein
VPRARSQARGWTKRAPPRPVARRGAPSRRRDREVSHALTTKLASIRWSPLGFDSHEQCGLREVVSDSRISSSARS